MSYHCVLAFFAVPSYDMGIIYTAISLRGCNLLMAMTIDASVRMNISKVEMVSCFRLSFLGFSISKKDCQV